MRSEPRRRGSPTVGHGRGRLVPLLVLLAVASSLSGCLLHRVYAFKAQFCDYESHFALTIAEEARLLMHVPVLYDSDVTWLIGAEPSHRRREGRLLELVYVVEKDVPHPDPRHSLPISLRFRAGEDGYRLREGVIHQNLTTMLSPALITSAVRHACTSRPDLRRRSVAIDLGEIAPHELPDKRQILAALGTPLVSSANGRELTYRYRLRDARDGVDPTHATVWFDKSGQHLERLRIRYLRYQLDADLLAGQARISFHL